MAQTVYRAAVLHIDHVGVLGGKLGKVFPRVITPLVPSKSGIGSLSLSLVFAEA